MVNDSNNLTRVYVHVVNTMHNLIDGQEAFSDSFQRKVHLDRFVVHSVQLLLDLRTV